MNPSTEPQFIHQFIPATEFDIGITLLLLHGTGGNEHDLLPLGRELLPGAALLGPRGRVLENGMPRFFRRFAEGVFDVDDLKFQTHELNDFIKAATQQYGVAKNKLVAVGYSNGANIAASLLLLHPHALTGAVLFRAMVPFTPDFEPNLAHTSVCPQWRHSGSNCSARKHRMAGNDAAKLGAETQLHGHRGGHELGQDDLSAQNSGSLAKSRFGRVANGLHRESDDSAVRRGG